MKRKIPKSFNYANMHQLKAVVTNIVKLFQIKKDQLCIDVKDLKKNIYTLCTNEMRRRRLYYEDLNNSLLLTILKEVLDTYGIISNFLENKERSSSNPQSHDREEDLFAELDDLTWKKVHKLDYTERDEKRLKELRKRLV